MTAVASPSRSSADGYDAVSLIFGPVLGEVCVEAGNLHEVPATEAARRIGFLHEAGPTEAASGSRRGQLLGAFHACEIPDSLRVMGVMSNKGQPGPLRLQRLIDAAPAAPAELPSAED